MIEHSYADDFLLCHLSSGGNGSFVASLYIAIPIANLAWF